MPLLKRANEQTQTEWRTVDEGLWRWRLAKPEVALDEKYGNYRVRFSLMLTQQEQARLLAEHEEDIREHGGQQSFRAYYRVGLSLGWVNRDGKYESTKLIDMLAACLGPGQTKKFRDWIAQGGGPPRPADRDDEKEEIEAIADWLGWWEDLEVYGTITHNESGGRIYANFAGPMPVGSLPGQKDPDYDALGRGKLRAIMTESGETRESKNEREDVPPQRYTQDGQQVAGNGEPELPF